MKTITGCKKRDTERAYQFNHFFNRFDCIAYVSPNHPAPLPISSTPFPSSQGEERKNNSNPLPPTITRQEVSRELRRLRPSKAAGPDSVCARMLKACAAKLGEPLHQIYNISLHQGKVPSMWKTSCLVPVP